MDRVQAAAATISGSPERTLLDVGCRDGRLRRYLPAGIEYHGCDLVPGDHVRYVGDITRIDIEDRFDCVCALDILEHVEGLHALFDKLAGLMTRQLVVSLPNCYDLKSRVNFGFRGRLGGKYTFEPEAKVDRHRWLMSHSEIHAFYQAKARQHALELDIRDLRYGDPRRYTLTSMLGVASRVLGPSLTSESVLGVFRR